MASHQQLQMSASACEWMKKIPHKVWLDIHLTWSITTKKKKSSKWKLEPSLGEHCIYRRCCPDWKLPEQVGLHLELTN